ncbi:hypothetical protein AArcS_2899 [Natranaeroarchaeum sulfidigenes]|uniref:Uncharacterized protein n=1 Tax=Natranaeroarchaeum sulfidigenes TaxID=2784880 RepID=A0A897MVS8_9EURY|nr:hypothetical protein AArcS_2899 [Natranaeroarchaeum sulfidigenes]
MELVTERNEFPFLPVLWSYRLRGVQRVFDDEDHVAPGPECGTSREWPETYRGPETPLHENARAILCTP